MLRELDALRLVGDRLLVRPPRRRDAAAEFDERLFRNVGAEGTDCSIFIWLGARHPRHWRRRFRVGGARYR